MSSTDGNCFSRSSGKLLVTLYSLTPIGFEMSLREYSATRWFLLLQRSNQSNGRIILCFLQNTICVHPDPHPYLALLLHRDYFGRPDASLACFSVPQRLFQPIGFIPILLFSSTGIISAGQIHLYLALLFHRDYFHRSDASLPSSFSPQGLFQPVRFISSSLFCSTGIISTGQIHLWLALLLHRDYFSRSNTSPIAESISARPFRHIPSNSRSLLFTSTYR